MLFASLRVGFISGKLGDFYQRELPGVTSTGLGGRTPIRTFAGIAATRKFQSCSIVASASSRIGMSLRMG